MFARDLLAWSFIIVGFIGLLVVVFGAGAALLKLKEGSCLDRGVEVAECGLSWKALLIIGAFLTVAGPIGWGAVRRPWRRKG
jgi:hypothetical protein